MSDNGQESTEGVLGHLIIRRMLWVLCDWGEASGPSMIPVHPMNARLDWDLGSLEARISFFRHVPCVIPEWCLWSGRAYYPAEAGLEEQRCYKRVYIAYSIQ